MSIGQIYVSTMKKTSADIGKSRWVIPYAAIPWLVYWLLGVVVFVLPMHAALQEGHLLVRFGWGATVLAILQPFLFGLALVLGTAVTSGQRIPTRDVVQQTVNVTVIVLVISWIGPFVLSWVRVILGINVPAYVDSLTILIWHPLPEIIALEGGLSTALSFWLKYIRRYYVWITIPSFVLWFIADKIYSDWAMNLGWRQIPGMLLLPVIVYIGILFRANLYLHWRRDAQDVWSSGVSSQ